MSETVDAMCEQFPIFGYLLGISEYEGNWFGDEPTGPRYWWRMPLRHAIVALEAGVRPCTCNSEDRPKGPYTQRLAATDCQCAERERGQAEGFAAAVQWLRDRSAQHPPATLFHAAAILADQLEQSRIPCAALPDNIGHEEGKAGNAQAIEEPTNG